MSIIRKAELYIKIKILKLTEPDYHKQTSLVEVSKGKRRGTKKYLSEEEIDRAEELHKERIVSMKGKYSSLSWI